MTFDKELELKAPGAAVTATAAETGKALAARAIPDGARVVFKVTALDLANADETYVLAVETDSAVAFASPTEVARVAPKTVGTYEVPLAASLVRKLDADAAAIRVKATLGGTTPSISYSAFMSA